MNNQYNQYPCGKEAYNAYIKAPLEWYVSKVDSKYEKLTSKIPSKMLREAANSHAAKSLVYALSAGVAFVGSVGAAKVVNDGTPVMGGAVVAAALGIAALHHAKNSKLVRAFAHGAKNMAKTIEKDTRADRKKMAAKISTFAKVATERMHKGGSNFVHKNPLGKNVRNFLGRWASERGRGR